MKKQYAGPSLRRLGSFRELTLQGGGKAYPLYDYLPAVGADNDSNIGCTEKSGGAAGCRTS